MRRRPAFLSILLVAAALAGSCETAPKRPPASSEPRGAPDRRSAPLAPDEEPGAPELKVKPASEEVVVSAWAEPSHLPPGGGVVQVLVRARFRGGAPFPGVEVRLWASGGSLFSQGRVLVTDGNGMTRDRLTSNRTVEIVMNAGGTRYRIVVPVLPE